MHLSGLPSWRMSESSSPHVLFALYVREACGIRKLDALPPLLPPIPRIPEPGGPEALAAQWGRWWATVVEPELGIPTGPLELVPGTTHTVTVPASGAEQLRDALATLAEPADEWVRVAGAELGARAIARQHGLEVTTLVNGFAAELGRPVHPFRLDVEILPAGVMGVWWIGQHTVAVSADLRDDRDAYVEALRPIVATLA